MNLVRNAGWGEFVEPGLGRVGDAGEDMQLVRRAFEKKRGGCEAEMCREHFELTGLCTK